MGRKRLLKMSDLKRRTLWCECGTPVEVMENDTDKVICPYCAIGMRPIPNGYIKDLDEIEKMIAEEKANKKNKERGRPVGSTNQKTIEKKSKDSKAVIKKPKEKPKKIKEKRMTNVNGKRGRKSTVGGKVLEFINSQKGDVLFEDILKIYSNERERLGKKSDPATEKRNCFSTLFIMKRDGKIKEVKRKELYASM